MLLRVRAHLLLVCGAFLTGDAFAASGFQPIVIPPDSFTFDVVVERSAPPPALPVTTASMEGGVLTSGSAWFERGYLPDFPSTGLPKAGSTFASETSNYHFYQMAEDYGTNNACLIDAYSPEAVLRFVSPSNYATLSFLTSSGLAQNVITFTVRHENGTVQTGTFISPDWYSNLEPAWTAYGRVNTATFVISDLNSYTPKLYSVDVQLLDTWHPVTEVRLSFKQGTGHTAVFAVSGAPIGAGPFVPIAVQGFDQDLVVEATAIKPGFMNSVTTATIENGAANRAFTWYERGYNPLDAGMGLPVAGSLLTNAADALHAFVMPAQYDAPNAWVLDKTDPSAKVALTTPAYYSGLSFLTAAGQGEVTNQCVVQHLDGTSETNWFVSPDWLGSTTGAVFTGACVSVSTRLLDQRNVGSPRLYAADVPVTNSSSKVTGFVLSAEAPAANAHAVILALSGWPAGTPPPPVKPSLSIARGANNTLLIRSTAGGHLESRVSLKGGTGWTAAGSITTNLSVPMKPAEKSVFYRLVVP